jgi:integrase
MTDGRKPVRVELKGVHAVQTKLADGTRRTYYYAWRGGPRLKGEPGSPEFLASYREAHEGRKTASTGLMTSLVAEFRASHEFKKLSEHSKRAYQAYLNLIADDFGDLPLEALNSKEIRGDFLAWRDRLADKPRKADYAWTVLSRILSFAKSRGRIDVNPTEKGGRVYRADRTEKLWTDEHISQFMEAASKELQLALVLALWTGQRQGDLLKINWAAYDGAVIKLTQSKTKRRVVIPVGPTLKDALDLALHRAATILTSSEGRPWTSDGFRTSWGRACERAGIRGLTFHDLRGSAVTRLALAGASVPEIASLTGHSLKDVETMLDKHYLGRDVRLAEAAMMKREQNENRTKGVK